MFMPITSSRKRFKSLGALSVNRSRQFSRPIPSRSNIALCPLAIPTTLSFNPRSFFNFSLCCANCAIKLLPTVPTPHRKRLRTWYSERKKLSWMTLSVLRKNCPSTTKEMFVSDAPCAQAITLIPLRPNVPNNLPAIPGVCFMFSPTMATVAKPLSAVILYIAPVSISLENSAFKTSQAASASASRTPMEVLFSEEACETRNTLIPLLAKAEKIRRLTPMTPTMDKPETVINVVPFILEIPLIGFWSSAMSLLITVPFPEGLNVFLMRIGIFFTQTG